VSPFIAIGFSSCLCSDLSSPPTFLSTKKIFHERVYPLISASYLFFSNEANAWKAFRILLENLEKFFVEMSCSQCAPSCTFHCLRTWYLSICVCPTSNLIQWVVHWFYFWNTVLEAEQSFFTWKSPLEENRWSRCARL
jgi:hypothetical protein